MKHSWMWKLLASFALLGLAVYALFPTIVYFNLDADELKKVRENPAAFADYLPSWMHERHIVPGLDLQGGVFLALTVDVDKAIGDKTTRISDRVASTAKEKKLPFVKIDTQGDREETVLLATFANSKDLDSFEEQMKNELQNLQKASSTDTSITYRLDPNLVQAMRRDAVDQTIHTIRTRIDSMGVTEPSIAKRGVNQIQIQLPGYDKPDRAKALIGRTAQLEFQIVDDQANFMKDLKDLPAGVEYHPSMGGGGDFLTVKVTNPKNAAPDLDRVKEYLKGKIPEGNVVKFGMLNKKMHDGVYRTYTLLRRVEMTGDDLVEVSISQKSATDSTPVVSMVFSRAGAQIFYDLSKKYLHRQFAIILEDFVDSAPVFQSEISGGRAQIDIGGGRTRDEIAEEVRDLTLVLKSGALPAPTTFSQDMTVGPTLGAEAVDNGKKAFAVGGLLIILFMVFYYRVAGSISIIGMIFNVIFILAAMATIGATITLPGVAGLLLTVGMAVDTNVIINERIREELRRGKMPRSAVKSGYEAAFSAVIDSHVTTFIGGLVLFNFGTGPVQNFAAMILIGTVFSIFTGVVITRVFFEALTHNGPQTISI